jgi:hypothetical protein
MSNGDFLEGELKSLKDGNVAISSVLFGLKRVWFNEDLTAVVLHDPSPDKTPYVVITADGSQFRAKSLKPDTNNLTLEDTTLGKLDIPLGTLSQLQMQ